MATVLVTGAGGFIGGRVAQRIALEESHSVRPLVHRYSGPGAMRLARLPVDIVQGSVTDADRMANVISGCDAVIHCAVGSKKTTVEGTRTVLEAAMDGEVETFIHLSSAAVHGHGIEGIIREESPVQPDTRYARWKVEAEREIRSLTSDVDLSPTIFRPYIVYGPHGEFVTEPLESVVEGAVLADGGIGSVNQMYVDNLIDAILLALEDPRAKGETFLLRDDKQVTWAEYYRELGEMVDEHPPIQHLSLRRIHLANLRQYAADNVVPLLNVIKHVAGSEELHHSVAEEVKRIPWAMGIFVRLPPQFRASLQEYFYGDDEPILLTEAQTSRATGDRGYEMPTLRYAKLHSSTGHVSNRKVKELLGWEQRVSYDDSMELIADWVSYAEPVGPEQSLLDAKVP